MELKKVNLSNYDLLKLESFSTSLSGVNVYKTPNGLYLKVFNPDEIIKLMSKGIILDRILEYSERLKETDIIRPCFSLCDEDNMTIGYALEEANGISCFDYTKQLSKEEHTDLLNYANLYSSIESSVRKANSCGAVFPDLLNYRNIFVNKKDDGKFGVQFIDYDGIQLGDNPSTNVSKGIINFLHKYCFNKEIRDDGLYTDKLDMVSLIYLYFRIVFNYNLDRLNNHNISRRETLWDVFEYFGIDDKKFRKMIKYAVYPYFDVTKLEYLSEIVYELAEKYRLEIVMRYPSGNYVKTLVRK